MYLIDTDVIIDVLRKVEGSREFILELVKEGAFISTVTIAELFSGRDTRDPIKREKLLRFLSHFEALSVTTEIAVLAGELRRDYGLSLGDAIIAATATVYGLTVATGNVKHFGRIKDLPVLVPPYRNSKG
ncbi:predicted nucleic acid-binding protein, containing PIN domain [Thermococcus kodakarensis KOD1]|uniref:Ribonuclease VapC n=1 Tax=Thermococcus kodakarensis (strain ATCC BAA-918 / JCM 12380 / KOD1) TaxID=69014 RepID=Q5JG30_THEKO|nr:type II toxin-antitoxin system VapC family toxin [Thermococcus kodakarensis]WCN28409.1 type II toxin-antitoxin system VapC family toxin [Thermococcus kodakarensis]WCN30705.1 type II toxin-antitoxin system VapC family toxin [Thermococcus kodakarensis]BAD84523.1 predicted nucleic acid-binding protein, containing PIN domain [Thermococcus kodakarensis KOD1]